MKDIVIVGAGGFAREVAWLIEEINKRENKWNLLGFIDDNEQNIGKILNGYPVLGNIEYLNQMGERVWAVIGIGNGETRKQIVYRIIKREYAVLVHPDVVISSTNKIEEGTIICSGNIITVNIEIGRHVIVNLDCTIGHDAIIEDFVTFHPSVNFSGNSKVGECSIIGTGSAVIQGVCIGKNVVIGAGTVIIKDIKDNCTIVGNPGRILCHQGNMEHK